MNFENMHGLPNPVAPAGTEDDMEVIQYAQRFADNTGNSVVWTDYRGNITKEIEQNGNCVVRIGVESLVR